MNEEIVQEVVRRMCPHLNNEQLIVLKRVLSDTLQGLTIVEGEIPCGLNERDYVNAFIVAKRIEGCS